jgi:hypothetical protein
MIKKILCSCEMRKPPWTSLLSHVSPTALTHVFTNFTPNSTLILSQHLSTRSCKKQHYTIVRLINLDTVCISSYSPRYLSFVLQPPSLGVIILNNIILYYFSTVHSVHCSSIYTILTNKCTQFSFNCLFTTHIFILHGRIPSALPHMQHFKILFRNRFMQHQLLCLFQTRALMTPFYIKIRLMHCMC